MAQDGKAVARCYAKGACSQLATIPAIITAYFWDIVMVFRRFLDVWGQA